MHSFLSNNVHRLGKAVKLRSKSWCQRVCKKEVGHVQEDGYHDLRVKLENGESLVTHIQAERNKVENLIPEIQATVS